MSPEELLLVALKNAEHITWCEECERVFDTRSGCETDIRSDERSRLREKVEAMRRGRQIDLNTVGSHFLAGAVNELDRVLALLVEP